MDDGRGDGERVDDGDDGLDGLGGVRRAVPAFPVPGLAGVREGERRRHLLAEIDLDAVSRRGPLAGRRRYVAVLGGAAVAGALVLALASLPAPPASPARPASPASVALLERAALAAAAAPAVPVRGDQYAYVEVVGHTTVLSENAVGGMDRRVEREDVERWMPVDGTRPTQERKNGRRVQVPGSPGNGGFASPTYAFAASLPSDPDALLSLIREDAVRNHGPGSDSTTGPDQETFVAIGDLLRSGVVPPATTAALYRAAARVPGVVTLPGAVDAAGRSGVAVARVHDGERDEWIFDTTTGRCLGTRTVLTRESAWGGPGTVVASVAVVGQGIVDEPGQVPAGAAGRGEER
ncbi:CU044_5270 family protein [Streptomyces sp. NPDC058052]|uniref:CU044_5270 family protein n=1 Tax=Streptomyces sp. NPDC058052 TaxID=3346316 RepID=UPI0036E615C1